MKEIRKIWKYELEKVVFLFELDLLNWQFFATSDNIITDCKNFTIDKSNIDY